jgi:hypothetical protein
MYVKRNEKNNNTCGHNRTLTFNYPVSSLLVFRTKECIGKKVGYRSAMNSLTKLKQMSFPGSRQKVPQYKEVYFIFIGQYFTSTVKTLQRLIVSDPAVGSREVKVALTLSVNTLCNKLNKNIREILVSV